jgi:hypothetical protein
LETIEMIASLNRAAVVLTSALVVFSALPAQAEYEESFEFSGRSLSVANLIGEVTVEGHSGRSFEVTAHVRGSDAREGVIEFSTRNDARGELILTFPNESRFVYPSFRGDTTIKKRYLGRESGLREVIANITSSSIKISGRGSGTELWVDLLVKVPAGSKFEMRHGVGDIRATKVDGDLLLDSRSGSVEVSDVDGDVEVDTGSGHVLAAKIRGEVSIDTGSGKVEISDIDGREVEVDTGSGSVIATGIRTEALNIDTGSGRVVAENVQAESALIDTGSGSVRLELAEMGNGDFEIDTGSGSITLSIPDRASASVIADTGSGGIDIDVPAAGRIKTERDRAEFKIGSGAARVRLDTGSGSITVKSGD